MAAQPSSTLAMLTEFFSGAQIEATARRTGCVQRPSKMTGKLFLALLTWGSWSDATTPLAPLGVIGVIRSHALNIAFNIKRLSVSRRDENRF